VERRDNLCSLTDGGRDPLHRAGPHVTDGEHAAPSCFQRLTIGDPLSARQHKTLRIQSYTRPREPIGVGICPNEQEEVSERPSVLYSGWVQPPADCLQEPVLNLEPIDLGIQNYLYIGEARDAVDEVTRHARIETCTANQKANLGDLARKIHDSLARGVARPDQGDLLVRG
jgi:hypothetical protein